MKMRGCAFCGKDRAEVSYSQRWRYFVRCAACNAVGPNKPTKEEAIDAWNNRKEPEQDNQMGLF